MTNDEHDTDGPQPPYIDEQGRSRISVATTADGPVEYRPGEMIVNLGGINGARDEPQRAIEILREATGLDARYDEEGLVGVKQTGYARMILGDASVDVIAAARRANAFLDRGNLARQPGPFSPNVVFRLSGLTASPIKFAGGFGADPIKFASDYGLDPIKFANLSTARPCEKPYGLLEPRRKAKGPGRPIVSILDTGFPVDSPPKADDIVFQDLGDGVRDRPDHNADEYLDIAAGHSTFIRTIVQRAAPTVQLMVEGVMTNDGDGSESDVAAALQRVYEQIPHDDKSRLCLNLSFSGYYLNDEPPPFIASWIRLFVAAGAVVVAAAGNDGDCRPKFPAAMPEVLAVGSIGPCGPSWFSNHGPWVDVCAPGEDLVSEFFQFDGKLEPLATSTAVDIDDFGGWAMWSGTSFSTPAVVGALSELIELNDCTATEAVDQLVKRRGLFRIPDYGVVVNRVF